MTMGAPDINNALYLKAQRLAGNFHMSVSETDTLSDGSLVVVVRDPELLGCIAHGSTKEDALKALADARVDYIYALLVMRLPVPHSTYTAGDGGFVASVSYK